MGCGKYVETCDDLAIAMASNNAVDQGTVVLAASGNSGYTNAISVPDGEESAKRHIIVTKYKYSTKIIYKT